MWTFVFNVCILNVSEHEEGTGRVRIVTKNEPTVFILSFRVGKRKKIENVVRSSDSCCVSTEYSYG